MSELPVASMQLFFSLWDTSRDGSLDSRELTAMLVALDVEIATLPVALRASAFAAADEGQLTFDLFRQILKAPPTPKAHIDAAAAPAAGGGGAA